MHGDAAMDWSAEFNQRFGTKIRGARAAHSSRYQVTNHRIELRVFESAAGYASSSLKECRISEIPSLPMVTSHRKSLKKLDVI